MSCFVLKERQEANMREINGKTKKHDNFEGMLGSYHSVVSGVSKDRLNAEEMELYRFMVGGMQAK